MTTEPHMRLALDKGEVEWLHALLVEAEQRAVDLAAELATLKHNDPRYPARRSHQMGIEIDIELADMLMVRMEKLDDTLHRADERGG